MPYVPPDDRVPPFLQSPSGHGCGGPPGGVAQGRILNRRSAINSSSNSGRKRPQLSEATGTASDDACRGGPTASSAATGCGRGVLRRRRQEVGFLLLLERRGAGGGLRKGRLGRPRWCQLVFREVNANANDYANANANDYAHARARMRAKTVAVAIL